MAHVFRLASINVLSHVFFSLCERRELVRVGVCERGWGWGFVRNIEFCMVCVGGCFVMSVRVCCGW